MRRGSPHSEFRWRRSPPRCISSSPTAACSPAPTRRPSCCGCCRGKGGWPGCGGCPGCRRWPGGCMRGSRRDAAAWCAATRSTRFRTRDDAEEISMTVPTALSGDLARTALRQVKDPELDMNIIDLGLVYDVEVDGGAVSVKMTLTSPGCPAGPMITNDAYRVLRGLDGVTDVDIEIVWEPYWAPDRMDPNVRALMGL